MPDLESQSPADRSRSQLVLAIMALFFPPLPVFLLTGPNYTILTKEVLISILLTIFGHLPGFIFSLYIIYKKDTRIDGYTALEDDDSHRNDRSHSHSHHNHDHHSDNHSHQAISPPFHDLPKDEPPQYDAIASSSNHVKVADTKDTKVQK